MFYSKNGLTDESFRWDNATIPFYIEEEHFSDSEIKTILSAVKEFHQKSCLRFKPYTSSDKNFVVVTGNQQGCWSSVGMKGEGGQQLNVNSPKCVKKGTVMHEFLHAAGFVHQQSASNRDEYVKIIWENISEGHESNFNKYNESHITDYGTSYDYKSIMHYSGKAFSKNGNDTIVALHNTTALGQRDGFTEKDLKKLNRMYNATCHQPEEEDANLANIIDWFRSLFTWLIDNPENYFFRSLHHRRRILFFSIVFTQPRQNKSGTVERMGSAATRWGPKGEMKGSDHNISSNFPFQ